MEFLMLNKDVKKRFGLAVKNWRGRSGISQEELAWRAGLHRSYVADIERGARNASLQSIEKLARALKVSLSLLFQPMGDFPATVNEAFAPDTDAPVDILLVEDDPSDVELTLEAFKEARFSNRVQVAKDGDEALDFIFCRGAYSRRKIANRPQVILLDLKLPKVDGLEVLRAIKADERTRTIRTVVLSDSRKDEDIQEALRLGAEAYIVKPVDFHRFSEIVPQLDCKLTLFHASARSAA
ncbi:MAG: hypothetical protein QOJ40_1825 [Verrucomicrobiota bacterium]